MVFHHINAYEEEGHLVFDMICYADSGLYDLFYIQNFKCDLNSFVQTNEKTFAPPTCKRFVLPLGVNKVRLLLKTHVPDFGIVIFDFKGVVTCFRTLLKVLTW